MEKYVAYYRVSTKKQGASGLGLAAQRHHVNQYVNGAEIISEFTEQETGTRKKKRIKIYEAIKLAKENNAVLIVAKLDRLARDVEFTSALYNGGVDFICCDYPGANKMTIQMLSVVAENEAEMISKRIREALAHSKKQLGTPANLTEEGRKKGLEIIRNKSLENNNNKQSIAYLKVMPKFKINDKGKSKKISLKELAETLTANGFLTANDKQHTAKSVQRLLIKINL